MSYLIMTATGPELGTVSAGPREWLANGLGPSHLDAGGRWEPSLLRLGIPTAAPAVPTVPDHGHQECDTMSSVTTMPDWGEELSKLGAKIENLDLIVPLEAKLSSRIQQVEDTFRRRCDALENRVGQLLERIGIVEPSVRIAVSGAEAAQGIASANAVAVQGVQSQMQLLRDEMCKDAEEAKQRIDMLEGSPKKEKRTVELSVDTEYVERQLCKITEHVDKDFRALKEHVDRETANLVALVKIMAQENDEQASKVRGAIDLLCSHLQSEREELRKTSNDLSSSVEQRLQEISSRVNEKSNYHSTDCLDRFSRDHAPAGVSMSLDVECIPNGLNSFMQPPIPRSPCVSERGAEGRTAPGMLVNTQPQGAVHNSSSLVPSAGTSPLLGSPVPHTRGVHVETTPVAGSPMMQSRSLSPMMHNPPNSVPLRQSSPARTVPLRGPKTSAAPASRRSIGQPLSQSGFDNNFRGSPSNFPFLNGGNAYEEPSQSNLTPLRLRFQTAELAGF